MMIAVTGATGFLGRAVCQVLAWRKHKVALIDRSIGVDIVTADMTEMLKGQDAVVHLAGVLGTSELFGQVETAIDVNIKGTVRVLEACVENRVRYVGITIPSVWTNIYQATKRAALELATTYEKHHGIEVAHVRAFNVFGEGQKVHGVQKIIPTFATRAWRGEPIPIWGDGEQLVDLIDVEQVAMAFADVVEHEGTFWHDMVVDAGTGMPMTVNRVADIVKTVTGSDSEIEYLKMRAGEDPKVDVTAKGENAEVLSFKPWFDPRRLETTIRWYEEDRP